jgi:magnesium transporter
MPEHHALTLAYMRAHPAEAAQTLDAAPAEPLAQLLQATPVRVAGPVLAEMAPRRAAVALQHLPLSRAAELVAALGTQASIAVLRHVPDDLRQQLLALLPTGAALAIRLLLQFPDDSVGSLADMAVLGAAPRTSATDALRQVRDFDAAVSHVLVLHESRRLLGWVRLDALLRAPESASLESLCVAPPAVLPATMPLSGALTVAAWSRASVLPVVDRGGRLVGLLARDTLARAAARATRTQAEHSLGESLAGALAQSGLASIASLLQLGTFWFPPVPPLVAHEHGD